MKKLFAILLLGMSMASLFATALHAEEKPDGKPTKEDVVAEADPDCD